MSTKKDDSKTVYTNYDDARAHVGDCHGGSKEHEGKSCSEHGTGKPDGHGSKSGSKSGGKK